MAGAMLYVEAPAYGAGLKQFSVEFPRNAAGGPGTNGESADGQTSTATVEINRTNLTSVIFSFTFTDNYRFAAISPAGATFRVTSPEGNTSELKVPASGPKTANIQFMSLNVPPPAVTLTAGGQTEAETLAASRYPATENGSGSWTVEVVSEREFATPIHPGGGSISWTMGSRVESYKVEVTELHIL